MDNFDLKKYLIENKLTANSKLLEENPNQLDIFSPVTVNIDKDLSIGRVYYNKAWLEFREKWADQNGIEYRSANELNDKIIDHFKIPHPENKNLPDSAQWLEDQGILKIQEVDPDGLPSLEDAMEDDEYEEYCDVCDMYSTVSADTPYGTCLCS